jgi:hypothetical protein
MQKSSNDKNMLTTAVHRRALIALTFLMWVLSSCTALRTPPSREIPSLQEPLVFLQNVYKEYAALEYFSALSRMKISSPRGSLSLKGAVVVRIPSCLRVEMFAILNQLAFLFATDGATMSVYLPAHNAIYTGKAANEHLAFLYGSDIPLQDAITLFLGYPHLSPYDASRVTWQYDNGCYLFMLRSDSGYCQQVWVRCSIKLKNTCSMMLRAGLSMNSYSKISDQRAHTRSLLPLTSCFISHKPIL